MNITKPSFQNDEAKNELRERFNSHLPKYGTLWRSMLAMNNKSKNKPKPLSEKNIYKSNIETPLKISNKFPNFLDAIEAKKTMTINAHKNNEGCDVKGCLGDCADPIIEFEISNDENSPQHENSSEHSSFESQKSSIDESESSSGEDLSSIAFDLSRIDLISDGENEKSQENLNMTVFDDDLINNDIENESTETLSNVNEPFIQDNAINARKSNADKNVQELLSSKSIDLNKSDSTNSTSTGEDLASIAFDISKVYIRSIQDEEDSVNLTFDDEDFNEQDNNYSGLENDDKSPPNFNEQSKTAEINHYDTTKDDSKTNYNSNQNRERKIDSSTCSTISCKEFVALLKNLNDNDDTNNDIKKEMNKEQSKDDDVDIKDNTIENEYKNAANCERRDEDPSIGMMTSLDQMKVPNIIASQDECKEINDDLAEYNQYGFDLGKEKRKSNKEIVNHDKNIIVGGKERLASLEVEDNNLYHIDSDGERTEAVAENTDNMISDDEIDDKAKKRDEEECTVSNTFDSVVNESISLDKEECENDEDLEFDKSESTSEEEWDDDYGEIRDEDFSSASNSNIGHREKIRSPTVLIVSDDDDISYYDNDDEGKWNDNVGSNDSCSDEVESKCDDDFVDEGSDLEDENSNEIESICDDESDLEDENFFDSGFENNENSVFHYNNDDLIVAVSSIDESDTSQRRRRTNTKSRKKKKILTRRKTSPKRKEVFKSLNTSSLEMTTAVFIRKRVVLSSQLFQEFNERAFNNALTSVPVTWSKRLQTTAGITRLKRKAQNKSASIELSTKVIDNVERLRGTLLHEMCHAAQWLVDGVAKPSHGACFKKWANIAMEKVFQKDLIFLIDLKRNQLIHHSQVQQ